MDGNMGYSAVKGYWISRGSDFGFMRITVCLRYIKSNTSGRSNEVIRNYHSELYLSSECGVRFASFVHSRRTAAQNNLGSISRIKLIADGSQI